MDGDYFLGLPVPAASAALASIVLIYNYLGHFGLPDKHIALLLVTYALAVLMVSTVPTRASSVSTFTGASRCGRSCVAVVVLQLFIARYDVFLFTGAATYVLSGPFLWVVHRIRGHRVDLFDGYDDLDSDHFDEPRNAARG